MLLLCGKSFCTLCINPSTLTADNKKTWKYPVCCALLKKGGDNSSTPLRPSDDNVTTRKRTDINVDANTNSKVKEPIHEVRRLTQEIHSLNRQLEDATTFLTHCQRKLEELLGSTISVHDYRIKNLEDKDKEI